MKKFLASIALLLCSVFIVACSGGGTTLSLQSYWLASSAVDSVGNIDETYVYALSHKQNDEKDRNEILSVEYDEGATYVVRLQSVVKNADGTSSDDMLAAKTSVAAGSYYKLTSVLQNVSGTYHYDPSRGKDASKKEDVAFSGDTIASVVYFKGTIDGLLPVLSAKNVRSTSPMLAGGIAANPSAYVFKLMEYSIETEYTNVAKVTFTSLSEDDEINEYLAPLVGTHTIKKYNKKSSIFLDNEQILFAGRALTLGNGFSGSFRTIDLSSSLKKTVKISIGTASKNAKISVNGLNVDYKGTARTSFDCIGLDMIYAGGGQIKTALYAVGENDRHVMVRYTSPLSDRLGSLVYTLTSVA